MTVESPEILYGTLDEPQHWARVEECRCMFATGQVLRRLELRIPCSSVYRSMVYFLARHADLDVIGLQQVRVLVACVVELLNS